MILTITHALFKVGELIFFGNLGRYKIFSNIFNAIRYRIIYLKGGIFDSDTQIFYGFWLKLVNSEWLIKYSNLGREINSVP